jgi:hypothetical protein
MIIDKLEVVKSAVGTAKVRKTIAKPASNLVGATKAVAKPGSHIIGAAKSVGAESVTEATTFASLSISAASKRAIRDVLRFTDCTEVQAKTLPLARYWRERRAKIASTLRDQPPPLDGRLAGSALVCRRDVQAAAGAP